MNPDAELLFQVARSAPLAASILEETDDGPVVLLASDSTAALSNLPPEDLPGRRADAVFPGSHASGWVTQLKGSGPFCCPAHNHEVCSSGSIHSNQPGRDSPSAEPDPSPPTT